MTEPRTVSPQIYLGPSPMKRARQHNAPYYYKKCILCLKKETIAKKLVTPTQKGKETLFKCMRDSDHKVYIQLLNDGFIGKDEFTIDVSYHRQCYQLCTRSSLAKHETEGAEFGEKGENRPLTRSKTVAFDISKCLFCNCYKYKGDAMLYTVSSEDCENNIQHVAESLKDENLLVKVQGQDLKALEAKYHKNCLSRYCLKTKAKQDSSENKQDVYGEAFNCLIDEIRDEFEQGGAFETTVLLEKYKRYLEEHGVTDTVSYRTEKLKARLMNFYGNKIVFHKGSRKNEPELVYSSSVDVRATINKIAHMKKQAIDEAIEADIQVPVDDLDSLNNLNVALTLWKSFRNVKTGLNMNPCLNSEDISEKNIEDLIPEPVYSFLCLMVTGKSANEVKSNVNLHRRILAIAQDMLYLSSNSRCKPPKHVGLAISVKHLTGSRQVLDMLHSQGHTVSYDDVCRIESAIATEVRSEMSESGDAYLPSNICPGKFSHAAMDNIDINEDTRSGQGTTHVLGSLIYQGSFGEGIRKVQTPKESKDLRRKSLKHLETAKILVCPNKGKRYVELGHLKGKVNVNTWFPEEESSASMNRTIVFARMCPSKIMDLQFDPIEISNQKIPSWKGVHAILSYRFEGTIDKTVIGYNPIIQGRPTEWDTIYTGLKLIEKQMRMIGQQTPVTTFDLQLYAIAQEIRLRNWDELGHHVIRLGGFHIMELYWKILGKKYSASGLEDTLVEAAVFGPNAASVIMAGKNYKRCGLAHSLMYEAMTRLHFKAFLAWLTAEGKLPNATMNELEGLTAEIQVEIGELLSAQEFDQERHETVAGHLQNLHQIMQDYQPLLELFNGQGKEHSLTFHSWLQYIEDIELAMDYIAAERVPSWSQHLRCFAEILCYAFAYDCQNYARWGPVYIAEMLLLSQTAPDVNEAFEEGKHVVTRSSGFFNSVWSDLGLEQTVVRDTKSKQGGIIGFSRQEEATMKWYSTAHERSAVLKNFKVLCGITDADNNVHHDVQPNVIKQDEKDIQSIMSVITDRFGNPFEFDRDNEPSKPDPLTNIATGVVASDAISNDLLNAKEYGKAALKEFVEMRIDSDLTKLSVPLKKKKLQTFMNVSVRKDMVKKKQPSAESDRDLFGRLLVVSQDRTIDMKILFEHELCNVPAAIANSDGSLYKANKSQTLKDIERETDATLYYDAFRNTIRGQTANTAVFIDHMACIQKVSSRSGINTFGDLTDTVSQYVMSAFSEGDTVHVVSDHYENDVSIKAGERKRRGNTLESPEVVINSREQIIPRNMKAYLSNPKNKDNLNDFVFNQWIKEMPAKLAEGQNLILAGGFKDHQRAVEITNDSADNVNSLFSTQEEADTRLLLHVNDSKNRYGTNIAIVWSPDTDVLVLCVAFQESIGIDIWFKTGAKQDTRYIPVHKITEKFGSNLCSLLLPFHTLMGCDSTSAFRGRGRQRGFQLLRSNSQKYEGIGLLGESLQLDCTVTDCCVEFVCRLYRPNSKISDLNNLRYKMFCKSTVKNPSLPPCFDSLLQHLKRCNYQSYIWKISLLAQPDIESPVGNGWSMKDSELKPTLMTQAPAPKELTELTVCQCQQSRCASRACKCVKAGLRCSPACGCESESELCENTVSLELEEEVNVTDDSDSDDD